MNRPAPLSRAAPSTYSIPLAPSAAARLQQTGGADSLKNGAITGAIAGGLAFGLLGSLGCAVGSALGSDDSGCAGPVLLLTAVGAGAGALIGVGVDALFEHAPSAPGGRRGFRKGVRVRLRF